MNVALWEAVFMLVVLKLPVVYLCLVVWWAIKAEPRPLEGARRPVVLKPGPRPWPRLRPRGSRPGPHRSPTRSYRRRGPAVRSRAR
jgi:hypothetical protein